jgi:hypothetical protein
MGSLKRQPLQWRDQRQNDEFAGCEGDIRLSHEVPVLGHLAWEGEPHVLSGNVAMAGLSAPGQPPQMSRQIQIVQGDF